MTQITVTLTGLGAATALAPAAAPCAMAGAWLSGTMRKGPGGCT
ncbi:hypothetical protein ACFQ3C_04710 [Seohaeicola saemankumensis]|uniref:Uncharacterized protein n=1 Tax=Seohaeicola saemankumensis TaxID=481181 RepID=A0ABW3TD73_9RHOB